MDTPVQLFNFLQTRGYEVRAGSDGFPGQGRRYGFYDHSGRMIINQLTLTGDPDYVPSPCCWGYLNMKKFSVRDLAPQEIGKINQSQTMRIHGLSLERLVELLNIIA